jgi:hypothetical protein
VLTLEAISGDHDDETSAASGGVILAAPKLKPTAETDLAFFRRKQKTVTVRYVSGDRIVAMIEVVSPGNKKSRNALRAFVAKAAELLDTRFTCSSSTCTRPPGVTRRESMVKSGRRSPERNTRRQQASR